MIVAVHVFVRYMMCRRFLSCVKHNFALLNFTVQEWWATWKLFCWRILEVDFCRRSYKYWSKTAIFSWTFSQ